MLKEVQTHLITTSFSKLMMAQIGYKALNTFRLLFNANFVPILTEFNFGIFI